MQFASINDGEYFLGEKEIDAKSEKLIRSCTQKRKNGMPLSYCLGKAEFMGLVFLVGRGVLIPRPETELLVEEVLELFKENVAINFADWCSGSGCIGISILKSRNNPNDFCTFVEKSTCAIKWNSKNVALHNLSHCTKILQNKNIIDANFSKESLDLITANPPYIDTNDMSGLMSEVRDYEPKMALDGGKDGLKIYKKLLVAAELFLKPGGLLAIETAGASQIAILEKMWQKHFNLVKIVQDYANIPRHVILKKR
ncbi:MAG: peptide chain release factor N(5)-glutamine methyltransferase [Synergistaceae bacterium]|nr:peptide chain release factor N(5)-glutamine methyltransferase [Synergistaceae bacterium]